MCLLFAVNASLHEQAIATTEDLSSALGFESAINDAPKVPINFLIGDMGIIGSHYGSRKLKQK